MEDLKINNFLFNTNIIYETSFPTFLYIHPLNIKEGSIL